VLLVLGAIVGFVVMRNWRSWAANGVSQVLEQTIDQSSLPPQEKTEVKAEVDRAVQAFRNGTMSMEQLGKLMQGLTNSPLMSMIIVTAVDKQYLDKSGLTDAEKSEGRTSIRRAFRGVVDKKIPEAAVDSMMSHIADKDPRGNWKMRPQVSDDDLKAFLAEAKAEADKAQIPAEPEDIDVSAEVKRIVDSALGGQ